MHRLLCILIIALSDVLFFGLSDGEIILKEIPENAPEGFIVYEFPPPPSEKEGYSFYQAPDAKSQLARKWFEISPSGKVTIKHSLSYETSADAARNTYSLTVLLKETGSDITSSKATTLRVKVTDINNFSPLFGSDMYNGTVAENAPSGTYVQGLGNCRAEDRDPSGIKSYKILTGNEKGYFQISANTVGGRTYLILKTTSTPIVRPSTNSPIVLTVAAEDGGNPSLSATTQISIRVVDTNNNEPTFYRSSYQAVIQENAPFMASVITVRATDRDRGLNGAIYYYLGQQSPYFAVNPVTGMIWVVGELSYPQSPYDLQVFARDRGLPSKQSSARVTIKIRVDLPGYPESNAGPTEDVPPYFPDGPYFSDVFENYPVGGLVIIIKAEQKGSESETLNPRISYALTGDNRGYFQIGSRNGMVYLNSKLDYESGPKTLNLKVTARVQGVSSELSASTDFVVDVQDSSDNQYSPLFDPPYKEVTLDENVPIGHTVTQVKASDKDSGPAGTVVYSIVYGSGLGLFEIGNSSGIVKTAGPLDYEKQRSYDLIIQATDSPEHFYTSRLNLVISLNNLDDNYPDFTQLMYLANVAQGSPRDTFVTYVHAVDKDDPEAVSYTLSGSLAFTIDRAGVIRTTRALDPIRGDREFALTVTASNSGKSSVALVRAKVVPKSFSKPLFTKTSYTVSVPENEEPGRNLLCIAATSSNGLPVKYSVTAGAFGKFDINPVSGRLYTTGTLDFEDVSSYILTVQALDETQNLKSTAEVAVTVTDKKDPPKFNKKSYEISLNEDIAIGTTILDNQGRGFIVIDDDTEGSQFDCSIYDIQSLAVLEYFDMTRVKVDCRLVTKLAFDTSVKSTFEFSVRATDKSYPAMSATAKVTVTIKDKNNHAPVFSQSSYWVSVPSSIETGSSFLTVVATDKDSGVNGDINYFLVTGNRFQLDGGALSVATSMQENTEYKVKIKAQDRGSPSRSSEVTVTISVYDSTQTPLTFQPPSYSTSLKETVPLDTEVFQIQSIGPSDWKETEYTIVGGNVGRVFGIDYRTGKVTVSKSLNYETVRQYKLAIRVSMKNGDPSNGLATMASEVVGTINIENENDNKPKFAVESDPTKVGIENHTPKDTIVMQIRAFDVDSNQADSIKYSITESSSVPSSGLPFSIDEKSGTIKTTKEIRYSDRSSYTISVQAEDSSGSTSSTRVSVQVMDSPSPPTFEQKTYEATVTDILQIGTSVYTMVPKFSGSSSLLRYNIVSGNSGKFFCIDGSGLITSTQSFLGKSATTFKLEVTVGLGTQSDKCVVNVKLIKANLAPQFTESQYTATVSEDKAPVTEILRVKATEKGLGANNQIRYSLQQTTQTQSVGMFEVQKSSGAVMLKKQLDYEQLRHHVLYVKAEDSDKRKAFAKVIINVQDVNDNEPRFPSSHYRVKLPLQVPVGYTVVHIPASDLDSRTNGEVLYNITGGNERGIFQISPETGVISVARPIQFPPDGEFNLVVEAEDKLNPSVKDTATVEMSVNPPDGPPVFTTPVVTVQVKEGKPPNTKITQVKAATVRTAQYTIVSGNTDDMFKIEPETGKILSRKTLDYEESPEHSLVIKAKDSEDNSATVVVKIELIDYNDNIPTFEDGSTITRLVPLPVIAGEPATTVYAHDGDPSDPTTYEILPPFASSKMEMDQNGRLLFKETMDLDEVLKVFGPVYTFKVTAKDAAEPPQKATATVKLLFVRYRPKEVPVTCDIPEDAKVKQVVAVVPRYYPDSEMSIIYPDQTTFAINNKGEVTLEKTLDYEKVKFYVLTAQEKLKPGKGNWVNNVDIEVTVLDRNDHDPVLLKKSQFGSVNGNSRAGARIMHLGGRDKDYGLNGLPALQLEADHDLTLNPITGWLQNAGKMQKNSYDVKLYPYDYGIPRRDNRPFILKVFSDQRPPIFTKDIYKFNLPEISPGGTIVGIVKAKSATNAPMGYSIIAGNDKNVFKITPSGQIKLNTFINYEHDATSYLLRINGSEQILDALFSLVDVEVQLTDTNEFSPRFTQPVYHASVKEDAVLGSRVVTVSARDCDCIKGCACVNRNLKYSLIDTSKSFIIDTDTGLIVTSSRLDYEATNFYALQVTADDLQNGSAKAIAYVNITVVNVNDNPPVFSKSSTDIALTNDAVANKPLARITATDPDHGLVTYSIVSGSQNLFRIDPNTGVISLENQLSPSSSKTQYTLQVRAKDSGAAGGLYKDQKVVIDIKPNVRENPKFRVCKMELKVKENEPAGHIVLQVSAEAQKKLKGEHIEFKLQGDSTTHDRFTINNATGTITTLKPLDRESVSTYNLFITAEDGGHGADHTQRMLGLCLLRVVVEDTNDAYPFFFIRKYRGSVWQNSPVGTYILTVVARDADAGLNAEVRYKLTIPSDKFTLDPVSGVIKTKRDLSSFEGVVSMTVEVSNKEPMDNPPTENDKRELTVDVEITVSPQKPPSFTKSVFKASVKENAPTGTSVLTVSAISNPPGNRILYSSLYDYSVHALFGINTLTGLVTKKGELDFEEKKVYRDQVEARDEATGLVSTGFMEISVLDINDDTPTFILDKFVGRVSENAPVGTSVLTVRATDRDTGKQGEISYALDPQKSSSQYFAVDETTGKITTRVSFDREKQAFYTLHVFARDKGVPTLSDEVYAVILIVDTNDHAPSFEKSEYRVKVLENAAVSSLVIRLTATDVDVGDKLEMKYFISGGDNWAMFAMKTVIQNQKSTGLMLVAQPLDYESIQEYAIQVSASDGRDSDSVRVLVTVEDVNDNPPVFTTLMYNVSIQEHSPSGTSVVTVIATDRDTPAVQREIRYSIEKRWEVHFSINSVTGVITTRGEGLDREIDQVVYFTVYAFDGKFTGQAEVAVTLIDVNDQKPLLLNPPYVGYIKENEPPGTTILPVQAVDHDDIMSKNTIITYTLTDDAGGRFAINRSTGMVYSKVILDRETPPNRFFVDVRATDNGSPPLQASTTAEIIVTDANDFPPRFTDEVYYTSVSELAIPGEEVIQIVVVDKDEEQNSESEFIITHGNDPRAFFIDPYTGMIYVAGKLNHDLKHVYNLTIEVWDRGMPPLKSKQPTFVIITIADDNDHIPEFIPKEYKASIYENATVSTFVVMVTAMDNDTNISYPLTYSITHGDDYGVFDIITNSSNTSNAVIVVSGPLDRESASSYELTVTVTDTGDLSATALVIVTILDVNDNGPHFFPPYYSGEIKEKLDAKQPVSTISAHDRDGPGNGKPFTYEIVNGTFGADFRLEEASDNTVKLTAYGIFLRTERTEYTILIMVKDSGTPQRYSFTYVYVMVIDNQNWNEPFNSRVKVIVHAYEGYFNGGVIGQPYYQDNDYLGDTNVYSLKSQSKVGDQRVIEYFLVESTTGDITAAKGLSLGTYNLIVSVEEKTIRKGANSPKTVTSLVEVVVVPVSRRSVQQSIAVQFVGVNGINHFVSRYYDHVQSAIFNILSTMQQPQGYNGPFLPISMYSQAQVLIFSLRKVQDSSNSVYAQIVIDGATNELDILFRYEKARLIQELKGLQIGQIWQGGPDIDQCALELQTVGLCTNVLVYNSYQVVSGDMGQIPAPNASLTVLSLNVSKKAEYTTSLRPACNCSMNNPCLNGGTCHQVLPSGCVCECPVQYSTTPNCMKSVVRTFMASQKSYLWIHTLAETDRGALQFDFTTKEPNGLLLYQGPGIYATFIGDFLAVHLVNGYIRVTISLGADPIYVELTKGARLDDGEWHTVEMIRALKEIKVVIDKCENAQIMDVGGRIIEDRSTCEISGVAKGLSVYLNAAGNLQIGGVENPDQHYPNISYSGFTGCIRNIIDNGDMYDLEKPIRQWRTNTGCRVTGFSCPTCRNQGYCDPQMNRPGKCICYPGFHGENCELNNIAVRYLNSSFSQYISRSFTSQTATTTTTVNARKRRSITSSCKKDPIRQHRRYQTDLRLQIRLEHNFTEGILFLATNAYGSEFHRVDVQKDGIVRYIFRLGDRMKILRLGGVNVTDGKYHNVTIKREGDFATVQLDYKVKVSGRTGGKFSLLDLSGGSIFVGGIPSNLTAALISGAFVDSGGKALVLTSNGKIVSSGSGSYGSSTAWNSAGGYTIVQLDSTGHVSHIRRRYNHQLKFFQSLYGTRALYPMNSIPKRKVVFKKNCFMGSPEAALGAGLRQINQTAGYHIYKTGIWGRRLLVATIADASYKGFTQKTVINPNQNSGTNSGQNPSSTSVQGSSSVPGQGSSTVPGQGSSTVPGQGSSSTPGQGSASNAGRGSTSNTGQGSATVPGQNPQSDSVSTCVPQTGEENGTRFVDSGDYGAALPFVLPDSINGTNGTVVPVINDMQKGCVSQSRMDNVDLDHDTGTTVRRQNVVEKCTLCNITCKNGGKCIGGDPPRCQCPLAFLGPTCEVAKSIPIPPGQKITNPPSWNWAGYLALILPLLIILGLLITWLCCKSKEEEKPAVVESGHGNIRAYHDDGVGDVDNMDFDMKYLIKYSYIKREHVGDHSSSANIRDYKDAGVGDVDNLNYDLSKLIKYTYQNKGFASSQQEIQHVVFKTQERRQLQGASAQAYTHSNGHAKLLSGNDSSTEVSSLPSETTSINGSSSSPQVPNMAHMISTRKQEVDRAPLIPGDETSHYSYEGQDSDAGDLSDIDLAEEDKTHTIDLSRFLYPTPSKTRV